MGEAVVDAGMETTRAAPVFRQPQVVDLAMVKIALCLQPFGRAVS